MFRRRPSVRIYSLALLLTCSGAFAQTGPTNKQLSDTSGQSDAQIAKRLLQAVATADAPAIRKISDSLGELGPEAVPILVAAISDRDPKIQAAAVYAFAFGKINRLPESKEAIAPIAALPTHVIWDDVALLDLGTPTFPILKTSLKSQNRIIAQRALGTIYRMEPPPAEFTQNLIDVLVEGRLDSFLTCHALEKMGAPAAPAIRHAWPRVQNAQTKISILELLPKIDTSTQSMQFLVKALDDPDSTVQSKAIHELQAFGAQAHSAIPRLVKMVYENDPHSGEASFALGRIGPKAIPPLADQLRKGNTAAASALAWIGNPAAPVLIDVLKTGAPNLRAAAAEALAKINPMSSETAAALRAALPGSDVPVAQGSNVNLSSSIMEALAKSGAAGAPSVEEIEKRLSDKNWTVRVSAANALGMMGAPALKAVPSLVRLINDPDPESNNWNVRWEAIEALGKLHASEAVEPLRHTLNSDPHARNSAARALGQMGAGAKPALHDLIRLLDDKTIREDCIEALGSLGEVAAEAVPRLSRFLGDADHEICPQGSMMIVGRVPPYTCAYYAAIALGKIGKPAAKSVPLLIDALERRHAENFVIPPPSDSSMARLYGGSGMMRDFDRQQSMRIIANALADIGTPEADAAARRYASSVKH